VPKVREPCGTGGTQATPLDAATVIAAARPGTTVLLRAGTYRGFAVPAGRPGSPVTVKPFDCAKVLVKGGIQVSSWTVLAGLEVEAPRVDWVLKIGSGSATPVTDVTVRNSRVRGGTIEAIRIFDSARRITLSGNDLDGGRDNHVVKVSSEEGIYHPADVVLAGNYLHKNHYGTAATEDLFQAEGHHTVTLTRNTFGDNPGEDGIDIKTGTGGVTVTDNYFDGSRINGECALIQGEGGNNLIEGNYFDRDCSLSVGANLASSTAVVRQNYLVDSELRLRKSFGTRVLDNTLVGGLFILGLAADDDQPRGAVIQGNIFSRTETLDRATAAGFSYECTRNTLFTTSGDSLRCSGTNHTDPQVTTTVQ
jgi:pectate lyase